MGDVKNDKARKLGGILQEVQLLDSAWMRDPVGHDDEQHFTPWMPFPLFDFIALVAEALPELQGPQFLEIGCGIGTRMKVAKEFFGLHVQGFDRVPAYVEQAVKLALDTEEADALEYDGYGKFDLIWFNRPFNDQKLQVQLEEKVWADMRPGAVVIAANLLNQPPSNWWLVLDDWEVRRGIWQKP